ncbi:hypothetical protein D3C81_1252670 [compost metagenome]
MDLALNPGPFRAAQLIDLRLLVLRPHVLLDKINLVYRYGQLVTTSIHDVQIIFVDSANLKGSNSNVLPDSVILMNDIIPDLQFRIAFDALSIIHAASNLAGFTLLLREHLSFGNYNQVNGGQLETGLQIALQQDRLVNIVILKDAPHTFKPLLIAGQHKHVRTALFPAVHLGLQHIHLPVEVLHCPAREIQDVLRLYVRNLTQE